MRARTTVTRFVVSSWRGSIVALVVIALGLPSSNLLWLDGLPMSEAGPFLLLISLLPLLASPHLRCAAFVTLGRRTILALSIAALLGLATKSLLLALGPVWGFHACYSSPGRTPQGQCEFSYSGVRIFPAAMRIDETVDFGPLATTSGAMTPNPYLTGALIGGVAATNWNLSYLNGLRFNVYDAPGDGKSENLPLRVSWRATIDNTEPRQLEIQLSGSVSLEIGDARYTAQSGGTDPRRLVVPVSPGRQPVRIDYAYSPEALPPLEVGAPFGLIRLRYLSAPSGTRLGGPFLAEYPALGWRLLALATDVLVGGTALVLAASMLSALHRSSGAASVLGLLVVAVYGAMRTMPELSLWPFGLACVAAPLIYLDRCRYPASAAWIALAVLGFVATVAEAPSIDAVVYRRPGSDWQTYESFARDILERGSLRAGEDVFHYQPGFRYLLFGLRDRAVSHCAPTMHGRGVLPKSSADGSPLEGFSGHVHFHIVFRSARLRAPSGMRPTAPPVATTARAATAAMTPTCANTARRGSDRPRSGCSTHVHDAHATTTDTATTTADATGASAPRLVYSRQKTISGQLTRYSEQEMRPRNTSGRKASRRLARVSRPDS